MARPKNPPKETVVKPEETVVNDAIATTEDQVNKVETTIVPDEPLVSTKSGRINAVNIGDAEYVTVHNKENGATNRLRTKNALQLIRNNSNQYEILQDGKGK